MAVAPHPALHRFGHEVDTSVRVPQVHVSKAGIVLYIPHPRNLAGLVRRKVWQTWSKVKMAFLPLPMPVVIGIAATACIWVIKSDGSTWQRSGKFADLLWKLDSKLPFADRIPLNYRVGYLTGTVSAAILLGFTSAQRLVLRQLLSYHGWLYERGPKSTKTKIWGLLLNNLFINRSASAALHAFQGVLPTLPLPRVEDTVRRYLETMEPILTPEDMEEMRVLAERFTKVEGPKLQWYLRLKWLISRNYVSDWWLDFVYLRGRESIAINSNWFGIFFQAFVPTTKPAARAAQLTHVFLKCRRQLESDSFEPQLLGGAVPLCMEQYDHIFSTTRVPGLDQDTLVKTDAADSRHIVVFNKGRIYRLQCYSKATGRILSPYELEASFYSIINDTTPADPIEARIPVLTCIDRTDWARIRENHFVSHPINSTSLEVIEGAIFAMSLDGPTPKILAEEGKHYLCGDGTNRWADKSFTVCIGEEGRGGVHVEHSYADAPTVANILEFGNLADEKREFYDENGNIKCSADDARKTKEGTIRVYPPERLRFQVDSHLSSEIEKAYKKHTTASSDLHLHIEEFTKYGKRIAKAAKCSPDAWIQMAFQLAYFRDQGRFDQTYEASMTRLFRAGRTETIRSASKQSAAFVQAMLDGGATTSKQRLALLREASERHTQYSHDAMTGKGVDRHLFALYVVSAGKNIPSEFLNKVLSRKWKLSTSQVPVRQLIGQHPEDPKNPAEEFRTSNGGFGPVADDGYGILYCIWGEDRLYFTISSKHSCPTTDSVRFGATIAKALEDMESMVKEAQLVKE